MKKISFILSIFICLILFYKCATIMHGTSQDIAVSSNPPNAKVTIDGNSVGNTPLTTNLSRKSNHSVKIELEGFLPYETVIIKKLSGWVWGNILFGGLVGLAIDAISGGLYKLSPDQVQAELRNKSDNSLVFENNKLFITVVLKSKEGWEKIGQLKKEE